MKGSKNILDEKEMELVQGLIVTSNYLPQRAA